MFADLFVFMSSVSCTWPQPFTCTATGNVRHTRRHTRVPPPAITGGARDHCQQPPSGT